ncbi:MAG: hypothetical protein PHV03_10515 [Desulfitobacteriaceae bacterium]|nr:hypothetical protein [Desulfitobacteriaceae bacterium]MDD4401748.1 hypothetical protein [Desulfitobacteriaceae bacterium]
MEKDKKINLGIGFATGRKSFQKVLKINVYNWEESGLTEKENVRLNLIVAYDLKYSNTKSTDYTNINKDVLNLVDNTNFIGSAAIQKEIDYLINENVITEKEAWLFFKSGYAGKRNTVLYTAMKNKINYLIFLDDDEYPMAVSNTHATAIWGGQHVLSTHLQYIKQADITNGYHCGYISPIPYIEFNDTLTEQDFRLFIKAISNDIINWDNIYSIMKNGGVTYADTKILAGNVVEEVQQVNHTKFISGSNLCINLTALSRVSPFYNPPGARGEDTFLSTCLGERKVLRVPCYTFHDGFSTYRNLMHGVLPIKLKSIRADSEPIINRFYHACIGWIRYKPLLLYITQQEDYEEKIKEMREQIAASLPSVCAYFGRQDFMNISKELERYNRNVKKHYRQYLDIQQIWVKISEFLTNQK